MGSKAFEKIRAGLEDALAFANGDESRAIVHTSDSETRALLAGLERELGVKGTTAVFRKALAIARAARAEAKAID